MRALLGALLLCAILTAPRSAHAESEPVVLFGAGSLREVMTQIAADYRTAAGVTVRTEFGPSGLMRERIERGERVDLLASADTGHPLLLRQHGLADLVAVFARNAVCAFAPATLGLTTETLLDRMAGADLRLGIAEARTDPLGDYTETIFELAERERPGSGARLRRHAAVVTGNALPAASPAPSASRDPVADLLRDRKIDIYLGYCSGRARLETALPGIQTVALPPALHVGPEYGVALIKGARPEAARLLLYILSVDGQQTLAQHGFSVSGLPAPAR